jgi:hypothetical protein
MPSLSTENLRNGTLGEMQTPHAQTRQEAEEEQLEATKRRLSRGLTNIPEQQPWEPVSDESESEYDSPRQRSIKRNSGRSNGDIVKENAPSAEELAQTQENIKALDAALGECWTLCNTLAQLSSVHRDRLFSWRGGPGERPEAAWKSCWKLCQKLYEDRFQTEITPVLPILELLREFCTGLFEIRERQDELSDAVLRVSFELNTHLYNMHDRNLPEAFRERTLDFYIALCHRLVKQRDGLHEETDFLIRAGWNLAEVLFGIRQNRVEGKPMDESLLGSAVQSCWELSDLFRDGWAQIRPERSTPRATQTTFGVTKSFGSRFADSNQIDEDQGTYPHSGSSNPMTPTTIDDVSVVGGTKRNSPDAFGLGKLGHSGMSQISSRSSKTSTVASTIRSPFTASEDMNITRFKILLVKAASLIGYQRTPNSNIASFVKNLSTNAFGNAPWQISLLDNYRRLVLTDPIMRTHSANLNTSRTASAMEVARSVHWMMIGGKNAWLRDLYRLVFGFHLEEADTRHNVAIQT